LGIKKEGVMPKSFFIKQRVKVEFAVEVYLAVLKYCTKEKIGFSRFVRDAVREKCDRDGIPYEKYEE
jgi:hypothetical protein